MNTEFKHLIHKIYFPILICGIIVFVHIFVFITKIELGYFGIYPRSVEGIRGILFAPFIHSGWQHLFSNIIPMLVLTSMVVYFYKRASKVVLTFVWIVTGLLVWLFGRENTFHIGASGLVYGLIAFVFASGLFRGNSRSIILALLVLIMYSGYFEGLAPKEGISWESHLYGAFSGLFMAFALKNIREEGEEEIEIHENNNSKTMFFNPDTFLKTKEERQRILEAERAAYMAEQRLIAIQLEEEKRARENDN